MGARRLALLLLVAACPATSSTRSGPVTDATGGGSGSAVVDTSGGAGSGAGSGSDVAVPAAGQQGPVPGAAATQTTLAEVGLEATSLDRSIDPCVDFYQFACGGWLARNPIPADQAGWSRFGELDQKTKVALRSLVEKAPAGTPLGDYYASCMDLTAVDRAGTGSITALLDRTRKVKDAKSWFAALTALHQHGIWAVWNLSVDADFKDSTKNVTYVDTSGLGLPDRDYYVKPELSERLAAYKAHVGRMLALVFVPKPEQAAADVVAIETALAKLTKTGTERRDLPNLYNPTDVKGLARQVKSIDWKAYWKALGATPSTKLVLTTPAYVAALDKVRASFKPAQWASYFTYHLLAASAFSLSSAFDDEAFALEKALTGVAEKPERFKRCVDATTKALGEVLGRAYVDAYFPPASKQTATELVDAIIRVMGDEIGALAWMTPPTRKTAQDKLAKLVRMVGFPETWRSYDFPVKRDDFGGNQLRAAAFETRRVLGKSGKPVDRAEWFANTFEVNAYYNPTVNNTALLAGILQPPYFAQGRAIAVNMGGIGMVIGHELTHAFDDQGAQFDAQGNLVNWWAKDDKDQFDARGRCVADQYGSFEVLPKQFINGPLTLGENIADLGGVKMAFKAYRALRKDAERVYIADGFSEDQQFFLSVGQAWCAKYRPDEQQRRLTTDEHSPPKFRVYGALRNLPEFAQAFSCAAGTPMRPTQSCQVW